MLDQNDSQLSNTFLVYNMFPVKIPHWWPFERHKIDFLCTWFGHPYRGETCLCLNIFTMSIKSPHEINVKSLIGKSPGLPARGAGGNEKFSLELKFQAAPSNKSFQLCQHFPSVLPMGSVWNRRWVPWASGGGTGGCLKKSPWGKVWRLELPS